MAKLTPLSKLLIGIILLGSLLVVLYRHGRVPGRPEPAGTGTVQARAEALSPLPPRAPLGQRPVRVALSQWPGHMALVVGAGGLKTSPGSFAERAGLALEIVFIEDAASKNKALQTGDIDFVWQTVDELPISLGGYRAAKTDVKAFLQIDWSRGGDACVASQEMQKVEDVLGRSAAMMMFSPDHTVFEFMITNSRLTPSQVAEVRRRTQFSIDDFTFGRTLFSEGKVDVACLWEPDVTLALKSRPGAHRLFSTADATELVADVLLAKKETLEQHGEVAQKLARVWFDAVDWAAQNRPAAAKLISDTAPRFKDELGYEGTLQALSWARWTTLADNVRFFGLDGGVAAFDRVYNQADSIWINYPQAEIKDRFAPSLLRDGGAVKALWEAAGKPAANAPDEYDPRVADAGSALFTKPIAINFGSASSTLEPTMISTINQQIAPQLEIARGMYVRIEGNTDNLGDEAQNQALSERRAQAIVDYLVARGVPKNRVAARGMGSRNPVASNKTAEGRARNRRTDVLFIREPAARAD
jgi:outer membrane protein OmpA-like peptidoglycan-associated protein/ABC-type nitrate/sulfonate/bicarbonate transport system substrate-binding protein